MGFLRFLVPAVGVVGTYVIVIICMIICVVLITGKSVLGGVKKQGGKAYDRAKEDAERRREASRERKAERAAHKEVEGQGRKRADRHVEGVSFDTTLPKKGKSPEMKEIQPEPVINRSDIPETPDVDMEEITELPGVTELPDVSEISDMPETAQPPKAEASYSKESEMAQVAQSVGKK